MRLKVDRENDVLYLRLDESKIVESEEVQPGLIVDYDDKGQVVGIGLLGISARAGQMELNSVLFQTA